MATKGMVCKACCSVLGGCDAAAGPVGLIVDVPISSEWSEKKSELVFG